MAKYNCEVFGLISYSLEISYHDLYEVEETLMADLQEVLENLGGVHLDFWGYGDTLQLQCCFSEFDLDTLGAVCRDMAAKLPRDVNGKLVCVDKHLRNLQVYYLGEGQCQGVSLDIAEPPNMK
ncbi:MAG: hypothetical protein D6E12_07930 [Desulfovibrio sp.]|nr:MAG: hypothetical protein D6E12_07930 [Desulfovibrio sp.]